MDPTTLLWLALIMTAAGAVQAAVGFGAGMFATPLMLLLGLSLPEAIGVLSSCVLVQAGYKTWHYRREVPWGFVWPMVWARLVGYGPGFVVLYWLADAGKALVKPAIGGFILVALAVQVLLRVKPRAYIARRWTWIAGFLSGLFAGAVGMGGPPVVLWVVAHDWPALRARVFLWSNFFILMPVAMLVLVWMYGRVVLVAMGWGLVLVPAVMAGTAGGLWLGSRIPKRELRWVMIGLLVVLAMVSIVG